jgi:hypothetical protein
VNSYETTGMLDDVAFKWSLGNNFVSWNHSDVTYGNA